MRAKETAVGVNLNSIRQNKLYRIERKLRLPLSEIMGLIIDDLDVNSFLLRHEDYQVKVNQRKNKKLVTKEEAKQRVTEYLAQVGPSTIKAISLTTGLSITAVTSALKESGDFIRLGKIRTSEENGNRLAYAWDLEINRDIPNNIEFVSRKTAERKTTISSKATIAKYVAGFGPATAMEIAAGTGLNLNTVRRLLKNSGLFIKEDRKIVEHETRNRPVWMYSLKDKHEIGS